MRLKADLTLLAVAMIWGTGFITQAVAADYHLAFLFNAASFILAAVFLLPFIPRGEKIPRGQWKWILIAGVILFIAAALQQEGILYTKIANAGFLTSLYTVFTPFMLWITFRERPHWVDAVAVVVACVGAYFLSTSGKGFSLQPGDVLETTGALFWAVHFVILGKFASKYEPIAFAAGQFLVCGVFNLLLGLAVEPVASLAAWPLIGAIVYRAAFSIGVGFTLQVWGQHHTPPTDAALILCLEAVFAVIVAWIVLSQTLQPVQIMGCVIIFAAVLFSQIKDRFSPPPVEVAAELSES